MVRFEIVREAEPRGGIVASSATSRDSWRPRSLAGADRRTRERLLAELRAYFAHSGFDANWDAINRMPDDMLLITLCMVCPFEPAEKQALLEARTEADRGRALLALLQMGGLGANDGHPGRTAS